MQSASISLKQAEKNWTDYEALPRDPRQSTAAVVEIKRNYDIYHNALVELMNHRIDTGRSRGGVPYSAGTTTSM